MYIIYKTTNLINGKIYIGQHKTDNMSDGYLGSGKLIIQAIKKYGSQNFKRIILQTAETRQQANNVQKHYIKLFNAQQSGYNIHQGGLGFSSELNPQKLDPKFGERNPFFGKHHSKQTKDKIKKTKRNNGGSFGERNSMFGRKHTKQVKQRISTLNSGRLVGDKNPSKRPEVREKLKQAKLGLNNPRGCMWKLISPQGQETIINGGIKRYFDQIGFSYISFSKIINGVKYSTRHKDWKLIKLNKEGQLYDNDSR